MIQASGGRRPQPLLRVTNLERPGFQAVIASVDARAVGQGDPGSKDDPGALPADTFPFPHGSSPPWGCWVPGSTKPVSSTLGMLATRHDRRGLDPPPSALSLHHHRGVARA